MLKKIHREAAIIRWIGHTGKGDVAKTNQKREGVPVPGKRLI
jgi:hypothetical protein